MLAPTKDILYLLTCRVFPCFSFFLDIMSLVFDLVSKKLSLINFLIFLRLTDPITMPKSKKSFILKDAKHIKPPHEFTTSMSRQFYQQNIACG